MDAASGIESMAAKADRVAGFLKGLASPHRLLILCELTQGERSVTDLIEATGLPQSSMSQHLAKLKEEDIVSFRREHRTLYYFLDNKAAREVMTVLFDNFCRDDAPG
ncbi:metalloregulator ArsR/SmtB family transcription factor [Ancylobacter sp. A5.8]|uniref:ArsR/SmtB family transcription factor n=1 Tax=Ancylobacter gelatini TaxID=2919920 RepID=UPI001F4E580C|nr:metalloregulator ArsR/SmtB family transcription factor [Ancylobacter gelatini]MCJ8142494.1 metalloregulator ArsR/SmtB family transcription factor [Ancylobacter gelatini]